MLIRGFCSKCVQSAKGTMELLCLKANLGKGHTDGRKDILTKEETVEQSLGADGV